MKQPQFETRPKPPPQPMLFDASPVAPPAEERPRSPRKRFDPAEGELRKETGISYAASKRAEVLAIAKKIAEEIATGREDRCVTADDVQRELVKRGHDSKDLGNAAGSLFRGGRWQFTGRFVPSVRVSNHTRSVRVWRLME